MTPLRAAVKADEDEAPSVAVAGLQRGNPPPVIPSPAKPPTGLSLPSGGLIFSYFPS